MAEWKVINQYTFTQTFTRTTYKSDDGVLCHEVTDQYGNVVEKIMDFVSSSESQERYRQWLEKKEKSKEYLWIYLAIPIFVGLLAGLISYFILLK